MADFFDENGPNYNPNWKFEKNPPPLPDPQDDNLSDLFDYVAHRRVTKDFRPLYGRIYLLESLRDMIANAKPAVVGRLGEGPGEGHLFFDYKGWG